MTKLAVAVFFSILAFPGGRAAAEDQTNGTSPSAAEKPAEVSDSQLNIAGVFNSPLPGTEKKYTVRFNVHPHIGDLTKYDVLRTTLGVRYGLGSRLELNTETNAYFSTGLRHEGFFQQAGFGSIAFGAKYNLGSDGWPGWDTAVGGSISRPVGHPPPRITDGFQHVDVFATFARPIGSRPGLRFFWGPGVNFVSKTSIVGSHEKNALTDDSMRLTSGFVWDRGAMHYTFETTWATTRLIGHGTDDDVFTIRPGFVWEIPRRYTFHSHGQWLLGAAFDVSHGPDGNDIGVGAKLRLSFDFKRWWRGLTHRGTE